ncbi:MAG: nitrophenyl compound nitroreductase subunit ArsF family protein [Alphaproteobacteria bacterium]|nr:nitrophenyl compound nitroreductase subunit ArsF family protein [Alphaproteobacteria bacterium]
MNAKKVASFFLLLFVLASVGTIIAKETGTKPVDSMVVAAPSAPQEAQATQQPVAAETVQTSQPQKQPEAVLAPKVIAYYFHGNVRCVTCRKIEELTTEAIQGGFAQDIQNGRVELKVVNIEEAGNEHYIQDYQLASRSVVLARYEGQEQKDWKRLDEVWQLVRDHDAFVSFVREETTNLLKAGG